MVNVQVDKNGLELQRSTRHLPWLMLVADHVFGHRITKIRVSWAIFVHWNSRVKVEHVNGVK